MLLLAIDIGNTSVNFGLFRGEKLVKEWRIPTRIPPLPLGEGSRLKGVSGEGLRRVIVSSVVPRANRVIKNWFPKAKFVNHKNIGIKVKVRKPSEVGVDRLVNALAASKLYGCPAIVIDFGTATTFDVVSAKGEYLGGVIAPGILLSRDILHERTAKLPKIKIAAPKRVIGNDTISAMQSGLVYGYVAMVEGMVQRIKCQMSNVPPLADQIKVVATGGLAKLICKHTGVVDIIDTKLTLKGLRLLGG